MTPLVSIVVLCHNYSRFLAEALDSALTQTYPNVEVVFIDDGSTDDSVDVASRYGDSLRLLTQANAGLARTCNRGAREANGEYFAFLSADDRFEPTYVEELLAALVRRPEASFAYCAARLFGAESGVAPSRPFSPYSLVRGRNYINGSALTTRADYLEVGGYSEDLGDASFDDWDFWLSMLEHGKRGTYVPKPLLLWRRHPSGSRNPSSPDARAAATDLVRRRHRAVCAAVTGPRARLSYVLDRGSGLADRLVGISRSAAVLRAVEGNAWRRFESAYR